MNIMNLFRPEPPVEAISAYFNRLPENIRVSWFRDGEFIIGTIEFDGKKIATQGVGSKDFIEMVNDAVLSMEVPQRYVDVMRGYKAYTPPSEELGKLGDPSVATSSVLLNRRQTPQLA